MIHLTNISKQLGSRLLFRDASMQILPSTRTGLVGPNGAGKTTLFRLMTGQEAPDKGDVSCSKRTVIGYFSRDVGEMSGRSALAEGRRAAFTLRLDAERHLRLRLACTLGNHSAQQVVTEALDRLLGNLPELEALAAQVARGRDSTTFDTAHSDISASDKGTKP